MIPARSAVATSRFGPTDGSGLHQPPIADSSMSLHHPSENPYDFVHRAALKRGWANIVVTDSGLGGLSVAAGLVERLKVSSPFPRTNITYFNALASWDMPYRYNSLPADIRARVFSKALYAMKERCDADVIVVACNTLSVVAGMTHFAFKQPCAMVDIVDTSVNLMLQELEKNPESRIAIFGTPGTISSLTYQKALAAAGVDPDRVLQISSPNLHAKIEESGPDSIDAQDEIRKNVERTVELLGDKAIPLIVSLNCTHYGYVYDQVLAAFDAMGVSLQALLNPNQHMGDFLFPPNGHQPQRPLDVSVLTQVELRGLESFVRLLEKTSPQTAAALKAHQKIHLFDFLHLVGQPPA